MERTTNLPEKLREVLAQIPDSDFARRLERVYLAAATAIDRLTDINLLRYESNELSTSADLSLWEEMAPVVGATVVGVNELLTVIRATFPENPKQDLDEILEQAVVENEVEMGLGPQFQPRKIAAESVVATVREHLAKEVTRLGETVRSPQVVSDQWNLLSQIQSFRTRFREEIGSLVFRSATAFADVSKQDIIPGYPEELEAAILVRSTASDLLRVVNARCEKVRSTQESDLRAHTEQMAKEMDSFGKTAAYKALRAQDKRSLIELRQRLRELMIWSVLPKQKLLDLLEVYRDLVQEISTISNRMILKENDRTVWAAAAVLVEQAQSLLESDPAGAAQYLANAASSAGALYGREAKLDFFLRKARKTPLESLPGDELEATVEMFRELLANLVVLEG